MEMRRDGNVEVGRSCPGEGERELLGVKSLKTVWTVGWGRVVK